MWWHFFGPRELHASRIRNKYNSLMGAGYHYSFYSWHWSVINHGVRSSVNRISIYGKWRYPCGGISLAPDQD
jgi:hypothetical protein